MLTPDLAIELAPNKITINSIAPGAIETPINTELLNYPAKLKERLENIPFGRLGKPEAVVSPACLLQRIPITLRRPRSLSRATCCGTTRNNRQSGRSERKKRGLR
jgi:NAD(P)-dependent dehydrogenase (short-subunit alcohol dehydrogenase family)